MRGQIRVLSAPLTCRREHEKSFEGGDRWSGCCGGERWEVDGKDAGRGGGELGGMVMIDKNLGSHGSG